ncbi:hypothetical protein ACNA6I_12815 [Rossellomorea sp. FS2]|uniref:hypothetical protein n=1 Tax=Rossellomorea sp. FS2 TaxID=3391447 RepID=UPI003A4D27E5
MNVIRRPLTLMLLAMLIIGGCSESADKPEEKEEKEEKQTVLQYEGKPLNIAVVGEDGPADFPGVTYHTYSMQNLANKDQLEYDAIIVMKSEFEEAAKKTFTPFFNSIDIPVFFSEADDIGLWAFTNEESTLDTAKRNSAGFIQGYWNGTAERDSKGWSYYLPDDPTEADRTKAWVGVFETVESIVE